MSMESFYGGRQGNPFIIVKRFDGIDIPEGTCKIGYYAYDTEHSTQAQTYFIIKGGEPIERTKENQYNYQWKAVEKREGVRLPYKGVTSDSFYTINKSEFAEGMVQCFQQGGATTSEVNYGEYVIIDTVSGLNNPDDIDNGKVFRRGMDFENSLGGAEFIGNIVGSQGKIPNLDMSSESSIKEKLIPIMSSDGQRILGYENGGVESYTPASGDLVPGFTGEYNDQSQPVTNDAIEYAWLDVRDSNGTLEKYLFGFKFPYLVLDIIGNLVSPYFLKQDKNNKLVQRLDDQTHPFYEKWQINIPQGIHGADFTALEIIPTYTNIGVNYYNSPTSNIVVGKTDAKYALFDGAGYNYSENLKYGAAPFYLNGATYWVKLKDTVGTILRYKITDYETSADGTSRYIVLGDYSDVRSIDVDEEGKTFVTYSSGEIKEIGQMNYVIETVINQNNHHLLVRYTNKQGNISYNGVDGYFDLGYVKGDPGPGLRVIANFDTTNDLPADPFTITGYEIGAAVSVGETALYVYDPFNKRWYYLGSVGGANPDEVVRLEPDTNDDRIQDYGIWFVTSEMVYAE